MPEISNHAAQVGRLVADYDRKLRLARATDLAKSGRVLEAECLLRSSHGIPEGARELDLLARVAVRHRHHGKALLLREAAMRSQRSNKEYRGCVEKLREWSAKLKRWKRLLQIGILTLIPAGGVAVGTLWLIHRHQARTVIPAQHNGGVKAQKSP